ncbi:MAG: type II toxin-antitoxin system RelE/ParE family toxin [Verrucomicrobiota bacterium]
MSRQLIFFPAVSRDYAEGYVYYENLSPGFGGARFEVAFRDAITSVEVGLTTHYRCFGNFHRVLLPRFPYSLYYRMHMETVVVVALLYSRYDPKKIQTILAARAADPQP